MKMKVDISDPVNGKGLDNLAFENDEEHKCIKSIGMWKNEQRPVDVTGRRSGSRDRSGPTKSSRSLPEWLKPNKKLLGIKLHFFFRTMGIYPLITFLTLIIRQRGVSPEGIGLIWTFMPASAVVIGTLLSPLVDYLKAHKSFFLISNFITPVALCGIYWTPHVGTGLVGAPTTNLTHSLIEELAIDKNQSFVFPIEEEFFASLVKNLSKETLNGEKIVSESAKLSSIVVTKENGEKDQDVRKEVIEGKTMTKFKTFSIPELVKLPGFWLIVGLVFLVQTSNFMSSNLSEAICYMLLGKNTKDYGLQKVSASISFGVCALATGTLIDLYSMDLPYKDYLPGFVMVVVFSVCDMISSSSMEIPLREKKNSAKAHDFFKKAQAWNDMQKVTAIVLGTSISFRSTFQLLLVEDLALVWDRNFAALSTLQGLIISVQGFCGEVPVMIFSGDILLKIGTTWSIILILFCHGIRYILYFTISNPWYFLPIEFMHGITYGLNKAALTLYVNQIAPKGTEASMFAVLKATLYIGKSLSGLAGGILWVWLGGSRAFLVAGVFILMYTVIFAMATFFFPPCCCTKRSDDKTHSVVSEV
ncbi:uncharacterized protein LOC143026778 [Oratosquilla oratoria]|uniref:uncharacterized protein LOC143026778 n=1 Tax=Oratosquilla oratoria TaxID=337810 RepID=UPI003F75CA64